MGRRFTHFADWTWSKCHGHPISAIRNVIAVPIMQSSKDGALADIREAAMQGAGIVELRLDMLEGGPKTAVTLLPALMRAACAVGLPVLATFRPVWEDPNAGYSGQDEAARLKVLRTAAELGAHFVDVEYRAMPAFKDMGGLPEASKTRLVVSSHDFGRVWTMEELRSLVASMRAVAGADGVVKVAQMASDSAAAARMLQLLKEEVLGGSRSTVALAMGEPGVFTRVLAPCFDATFTFGCLPGRASAPGQPTVTDMLEVFRLQSASRKTEIFGLLGDPVVDSRLPALLNAGFAAAGHDAIYAPLLVRGCSLQEFLASLPEGLLTAASVAPSHARAALEIAGEHDEACASRGQADVLLMSKGACTARSCSMCSESGAVEQAMAHYELLCGRSGSELIREAMRRQLLDASTRQLAAVDA